MMRRYHPRGLQAIEPQALFAFFMEPEPTENEENDLATIVTIRGPLVQHGGWWGDSYESIRRRVADACDQMAPYVVLQVDSPGGEVAGCFDTARAIRAMCDKAGKTLIVHVEGQCSSAAYALSCVADRVVALRQRFKTLKTLRVILASDEVAVKGRRAHVSTGDGLCYAAPGTHTDLLPIGRFMESFTGDGSRTTVVDLFEEIVVHGWNNDSAPNNVQTTDLFNEVYLLDGATVSTSDNGGTRSSGGRAILLEDGLVYVRAGL